MSTMQVRVRGELVEREVAHITRTTNEDGSVVEYPEPLLKDGEVVFRDNQDEHPIIVVRTIPA